MIALDLPPRLEIPKPSIIRLAEHSLLRPGAFRAVSGAEQRDIIVDLVRTKRLTPAEAKRALLFVPLVGWSVADAGWILVGSTGASITSDGTNVDLPGLPAEGDIVLVGQGCDAEHIVAPNTSGYTQIASSGGGSSPGYELHFKIMGAAPDSVVNLDAGNGTTQVNAVVIQVWRGVDQTTPFDGVTPTTATGSFGLPNAPSITPITDGALVFAFGVLDDDDDPTITPPSGYSNLQARVSGGSGGGATTMLASKVVSIAQAENAGAFSGTDSDEWFACSFCLRLA